MFFKKYCRDNFFCSSPLFSQIWPEVCQIWLTLAPNGNFNWIFMKNSPGTTRKTLFRYLQVIISLFINWGHFFTQRKKGIEAANFFIVQKNVQARKINFKEICLIEIVSITVSFSFYGRIFWFRPDLGPHIFLNMIFSSFSLRKWVAKCMKKFWKSEMGTDFVFSIFFLNSLHSKDAEKPLTTY